MKSKRKPAKLTGKKYKSAKDLITDKLVLEKIKLIELYPLLMELNFKVKTKPYDHITWTDLKEGLKINKIDEKKFGEYFGVQTVGSYGPYASDLEAVLHRILKNKLIGTQHPALWD